MCVQTAIKIPDTQHLRASMQPYFGANYMQKLFSTRDWLRLQVLRLYVELYMTM